MQVPRDFLGKIIWNGASSIPKMADKIDRDEVRRLKILRVYAGCGDSQTRFATKYGFTVKQWNNFERGFPLSKEVAIQLVQKIPGLTLDWLHLGKGDGLPGRLRAELEAAEAELEADEAAEKTKTSAEGKARRR